MTATTETHEGYVTKAWPYITEDGREITCFTLDGSPGAFWGDETWFSLLIETIELKTWCRVVADLPASSPYLVRAESIEWV